MKIIKQTAGVLALLLCLTFSTRAQNPLLSLPSKYFDMSFVTNLPQSPTTPTPTNGYAGGTSLGPHNMYADANNKPLFFVAADNSMYATFGQITSAIYNRNGYRIANLAQNSSGDGVISQAETAVVSDPGNCSRYYVFGSFEDFNTNPGKYCPYYTYIDMSQQTPNAPYGEEGKLIQATNASGGNIKNMYDSDLTPNYLGSVRPNITNVYIAVTKPRTSDGNSRYVFVYNGYFFYIYKVTTTGVQFVQMNEITSITGSGTYSGNIDYATGELEIFEDNANNKIKIAFPLFTTSASNPSSIDLGMVDFSTSTNAYSSFHKICIGSGACGPQVANTKQLCGIEFSQNGNYVYFTHEPTPNWANPVEWVEYANTSNRHAITPTGITMTDFQYSQIELGLDGMMYYATNNKLTVISHSNSPSTTITYPYNSSVYSWNNSAVSLGTYTLTPYFLPDQIDQDTYGGFYSATPACCKTYGTFNIEKDFTLPVGTGSLTIGPTFPQAVTGTDSQNNPMTVVFTATTTAKANIIVPAGLSVTFSSMTVQFTKDAGVTVKKQPTSGQGGKLKLTNSTLTWYTGCENEFWKGVYLEGNDLVAQGTSTNSVNAVLTQVNSQIDHALTAIYIEHGAIAQFNGRLYDNKVAVEASTYTPTTPTTNDVSFFQSATIKTQSSYLTSLGQPSYFVGITNRQPAIRFLSCTFTNDASTFHNTYDGIISNTSAVTSTGSTFTRLRYGVYHTSATVAGSRKATVSTSTFNNNNFGVYIGNSNTATVGGSHFHIIDNTTTCQWPYGLRLDNSSQFLVSINDFSNFSATTATVSAGGSGGGTTGLIATNTNSTDNNYVNILEKNTFEKLHMGVSNDGVNYCIDPALPNPRNVKGLRYYCNRFIGPNIPWYDFVINGGTISYNQGVANYAAQNEFTTSGATYNVYVNMSGLPVLTPTTTLILYLHGGTGVYLPTVDPAASTYFTLANQGSNVNDCTTTAIGSTGGRLFNETGDPERWLTQIDELQTLIEGAGAENFSEENEADISYWTGRQDQLRSELVAYYLNDTITESAVDSAYKYMLAFAGNNKPQLISIYFDKGDIAAAQDVYDQLHAEQPGSNTDRYYAALLSLYNKDIAHELLTNTELYNEVLDLASDSSDRSVFMMSRTLLNQLNLNAYRPYYGGIEPPISAERKLNPVTNIENTYNLSNHPNPFTNSTTITASIPKGTSDAAIVITDVLGREVASFRLAEGNNTVTFEKQDASGLLFYTLYIDGIRKETKLMMKSSQ